jgi:hypothetical protein
MIQSWQFFQSKQKLNGNLLDTCLSMFIMLLLLPMNDFRYQIPTFHVFHDHVEFAVVVAGTIRSNGSHRNVVLVLDVIIKIGERTTVATTIGGGSGIHTVVGGKYSWRLVVCSIIIGEYFVDLDNVWVCRNAPNNMLTSLLLMLLR